MSSEVTSDVTIEDNFRRGPLAARFSLRVAKHAFCRLDDVSFENSPIEWVLYFNSTIVSARAALDALRGPSHRKPGGADGSQNSIIAEEWASLFETDVRHSPLFKELLDGERNILSHGLVGAAVHPAWPIDTVFRHGDLSAIFDTGPPTWPDGQFKGLPVIGLLESMLVQVGHWIDELDKRRDLRTRELTE